MASVYTVAQVNAYIKNMFTQDFALNRISVKGEVSNCKYHTSGHIYFTLKDGSGTIAAVMFASQRKNLGFRLQEGQQVIAGGSVNIYERDGRYQLYVNKVELDGTGDLFRRFEALRNSLEEMGMFAPEYKQPIPRYAMKVGIVTAPTGAAIRDIMNISARRNPYVQLYLYPALVQGEAAAASIVRGIKSLDDMGMDVLIVGRGGGPIEDLWAFNEEIVARAIFQCRTPVISAVGHETDVTIADYVADMRAPTPSAAAELAVFDYRMLENQLSVGRQRLDRTMARMLNEEKGRLEQLRLRLQFGHPGRRLEEHGRRLKQVEGRLDTLMEQRLIRDRHRLALLGGRLQGQSPLERISHGFAFVTDGRNHRVESVKQVRPGDVLQLRLCDGRITARAEESIDMEQSGRMEDYVRDIGK